MLIPSQAPSMGSIVRAMPQLRFSSDKTEVFLDFFLRKMSTNPKWLRLGLQTHRKCPCTVTKITEPQEKLQGSQNPCNF